MNKYTVTFNFSRTIEYENSPYILRKALYDFLEYEFDFCIVLAETEEDARLALLDYWIMRVNSYIPDFTDKGLFNVECMKLLHFPVVIHHETGMH